jgi:hypothetical protein
MTKKSSRTKRMAEWLAGSEIMDQWGIREIELRELVRNGLRPFNSKTLKVFLTPEAIEEVEEQGSLSDVPHHRINDWGDIPDLASCVFNKRDFQAISKECGLKRRKAETSDPLEAAEKKELGTLRREKEKWNESIGAAVAAGVFCAKRDKPVTHNELERELINNRKYNLPTTTLDKIWKALPGEYRSRGGRRAGDADTSKKFASK